MASIGDANLNDTQYVPDANCALQHSDPPELKSKPGSGFDRIIAIDSTNDLDQFAVPEDVEESEIPDSDFILFEADQMTSREQLPPEQQPLPWSHAADLPPLSDFDLRAAFPPSSLDSVLNEADSFVYYGPGNSTSIMSEFDEAQRYCAPSDIASQAFFAPEFALPQAQPQASEQFDPFNWMWWIPPRERRILKIKILLIASHKIYSSTPLGPTPSSRCLDFIDGSPGYQLGSDFFQVDCQSPNLHQIRVTDRDLPSHVESYNIQRDGQLSVIPELKGWYADANQRCREGLGFPAPENPLDNWASAMEDSANKAFEALNAENDRQ